MTKKRNLHIQIAPILMMLSALCFSFMSTSIKYAADIPFIQKVFFRNIIMLIIAIPLLIKESRTKGFHIFFGKKGNRMFLLFRSFFGFSGVICYFYSITKLPLGDSAMINKLSAFFVIIIAACFLKEKIRAYQVPALLSAFAGTVLIIKPGFNITLFPSIVGLAGSMFAAFAYSIIASIKGKESPITIIFWFAAISTIASFVPAVMYWKHPQVQELIALLLTGIFAAGGQYFLTRGYSMGNAGEISIYNYTQVFFSVVIDLLIWRLLPDFFSVAGSVLIIAAAILLYKKRSQ